MRHCGGARSLRITVGLRTPTGRGNRPRTGEGVGSTPTGATQCPQPGYHYAAGASWCSTRLVNPLPTGTPGSIPGCGTPTMLTSTIGSCVWLWTRMFQVRVLGEQRGLRRRVLPASSALDAGTGDREGSSTWTPIARPGSSRPSSRSSTPRSLPHRRGRWSCSGHERSTSRSGEAPLHPKPPVKDLKIFRSTRLPHRGLASVDRAAEEAAHGTRSRLVQPLPPRVRRSGS